MAIREVGYTYGAAAIAYLDPVGDLEPSELELHTIEFSVKGIRVTLARQYWL